MSVGKGNFALGSCTSKLEPHSKGDEIEKCWREVLEKSRQ